MQLRAQFDLILHANTRIRILLINNKYYNNEKLCKINNFKEVCYAVYFRVLIHR